MTVVQQPSPIPSGFPTRKYQILMGASYLTFVYIIGHFIYPYMTFLPPPDVKYCPQQEPCDRPDLFAFELACSHALILSGVIGFLSWHYGHCQMFTTPELRLFGYIRAGEQLTTIGTTFQGWDLIMSIIIPEQCSPIMLAHHVLATLVAWYGLNNQYFHYYGVYFLGCIEVSGIFLVIIDFSKFFPPIPGTLFDFIVNGIAGPAFALTFTIYRVCMWWPTSIQMYKDIFHVTVETKKANKVRPGRNHVLYMMLVVNLLLGFLQLFWFTIILNEAKKVLIDG